MKSNSTMRLFLALWPAEGLREALVAWQRGWSWSAGAALVRPERLHLTLHCLGAVDAERVPALRDGLAVACEPFELDLQAGRAGVWPGGIAVLETAAPAPLLDLHARLGKALQALGLPLEARPWRPHLTFARKAAGSRPPPAGPAAAWQGAGGYVLARSTPGQGYTIVHSHGPH